MTDLFYQQHVFCCTNQRGPDAKRRCCAAGNSDALRDYMKKKVKALGINTAENRIRINSAGCLDRCEQGPVLVIYPEGVWYRYDSEADIDAIIQAHFIDRQPLPRLMLPTPKETTNA